MSLNEAFGKKPSNGLQRSQSFAGMLNKPVLGEPLRSPRLQRKHIYRSQTDINLGYSFKKTSSKMPRVPRPNRMAFMFESIKRGLRDCIHATGEDIETLQTKSDDITNSSTAQAKLFDIEKQIKAAERYQKRLEFQLAKVEELHDCYILQSRLREGTRNMAKAYVSSPGKQREHLSNVKMGYKETTQAMCAIEAQLEAIIGSFNCRIKGLVGFARLCPGDVFEITIRHGMQKWKSRGKVTKNNQQKWENGTFIFKALLGHVITVKAVEARTLGRNSVLGEKHCETKDLFCSHPQMMTVNVNHTGTIKLSIIISWNPLDSVEDTKYYDPPTLMRGTPKAASTLALTSVGVGDWRKHSDNASTSTDGSSSPGPHSRSTPYLANSSPGALFTNRQRFENLRTTSPLNPNRYSMPAELMSHEATVIGNRHSVAVEVHNELEEEEYNARVQEKSKSKTDLERKLSKERQILSSHKLNEVPTPPKKGMSEDAIYTQNLRTAKPHLFDMRLLSESSEGLMRSVAPSDEPQTIEEALSNLKIILEDYQGQYTELQHLEEQVSRLDSLLVKHSRKIRSRSSSIHSVSIESALEAFDFLKNEDSLDDFENPNNNHSRKSSRRPSLENKPLISPESTTKTADSGIESLAHRLHEDGHIGSSLGSSPEPATTGNEQVDQALLFHLIYCERLMENVGNFGPLKCKEIYSLDKLERQGDMIEKMLDVAVHGKHINVNEVMSQLTTNARLKEFWLKCVDQNVLYVNCERFLAQLERSYGERLREKYDIVATKVFRRATARILDIPSFDPEAFDTHSNITLYQFMLFFGEEGGKKSVAEYVEDVAGELWLCSRLRSGDTDLVLKTLTSFKDTLPPSECLKVLALLLITNNKEIKQSTITYLKGLHNNKVSRNKAMIVYVEALEDRNADIRCGACMALGALGAVESIDQLVYICQTDNSSVVKGSAKEALLSFGAEGRKAYEESTLRTHGFQGVDVKKFGSDA